MQYFHYLNQFLTQINKIKSVIFLCTFFVNKLKSCSLNWTVATFVTLSGVCKTVILVKGWAVYFGSNLRDVYFNGPQCVLFSIESLDLKCCVFRPAFGCCAHPKADRPFIEFIEDIIEKQYLYRYFPYRISKSKKIIVQMVWAIYRFPQEFVNDSKWNAFGRIKKVFGPKIKNCRTSKYLFPQFTISLKYTLVDS